MIGVNNVRTYIYNIYMGSRLTESQSADIIVLERRSRHDICLQSLVVFS